MNDIYSIIVVTTISEHVCITNLVTCSLHLVVIKHLVGMDCFVDGVANSVYVYFAVIFRVILEDEIVDFLLHFKIYYLDQVEMP